MVVVNMLMCELCGKGKAQNLPRQQHQDLKLPVNVLEKMVCKCYQLDKQFYLWSCACAITYTKLQGQLLCSLVFVSSY